MRQRRKDHQPTLFTGIESSAEAVESVLPCDPQETVGTVVTERCRDHAYVTGKELDKIVRDTYAQYESLKRRTGCKL